MRSARPARKRSTISSSVRPHVLWLRRAPSDLPYAEIARHLADEFDIDFCDWDEDEHGRKRARSLIVQRPANDREPVAITVPRWGAVRALLTSNVPIVIVKEVGLLTALAGVGSVIRRHRKVVCLVQHHPRHGGPAVAAGWKRPFRRLLGAGVDTFVANTEDAAHWLTSEVGVSPGRVVHRWWLAGLENTDLAPSIGTRHTAIRLVFAGSLTARKRPQLAIELVAELARLDVASTLAVLGAGNRRAELEALATTLDVASSVTFHGHVQRSRLPDHFSKADLFILPSAEELLGRVVVEAMSCGLPAIVASTVGAAHGLVVDGMNGLVEHSDDPVTWARRIADLSESDWARLRAQAAASATSLGSESCADRIRAILRSELEAR